MALPKAYQPEQGYTHQILCRNTQYSRTFEHCDYAISKEDKKHLLCNYKLAYGNGWEFKCIPLPVKYHPKAG